MSTSPTVTVDTPVQWTLSPSNSWVFRTLAASYVFVFGGFFLLVGTAVFGFVIFGIQSVYGFLLAVVTLALLLAYRRRSPTRHNNTWGLLRSELGTGTVALVAVLGASGFGLAFVTLREVTLLLFGVSALGIGVIVGTVGGFRVEGRFDSRSGRLESGATEVVLGRGSSLRPKPIGDVVVIRARSEESGRSSRSTLVVPRSVFSELRDELVTD